MYQLLTESGHVKPYTAHSILYIIMIMILYSTFNHQTHTDTYIHILHTYTKWVYSGRASVRYRISFCLKCEACMHISFDIDFLHSRRRRRRRLRSSFHPSNSRRVALVSTTAFLHFVLCVCYGWVNFYYIRGQIQWIIFIFIFCCTSLTSHHRIDVSVCTWLCVCVFDGDDDDDVCVCMWLVIKFSKPWNDDSVYLYFFF